MFKILASGGRKPRRSWSPATAAASLAAHVALFAAVGYAAVGTASPLKKDEEVIQWTPLGPPPPPPVEPRIEAPPPQAPQPVKTDEPAPVVGQAIAIVPPPDVPKTIAAPSASDIPVTAAEVNAPGKLGDVMGVPNPADTRSATGVPATSPGVTEGDLVEAEALSESPAVQNRREVQRALERLYPATLRDAGVAGRAVLQFIVNTDGRVDPASIRVVSATHEQFGDASRRAVERFRFRPARINGTPVRVLISLPIDWVAPAS